MCEMKSKKTEKEKKETDSHTQHAHREQNIKHTVQVVSQVQGFHGKPENLLSKCLNEIKMFPFYLCVAVIMFDINELIAHL